MAGSTIQVKPRARPMDGGFATKLGNDRGFGTTLDSALGNLQNNRAARIQREQSARRASEHFKHVKEVAAERAQ